MRYLRLRKSFVMSHPKKLEIANKILDYRADKKCILFTATVKEAELFKSRALVCHSHRKKNDNKQVIEYFNTISTGNIISPSSLRTGVDIKGLSVGIALSCNSSKILGIQSLGRVVRFENDKVAEFFTLVIKNSIDEQ
ncbi:helicase-related protein [Clostridium sp.]|uniref:helicase-related protein n=1 Tax=Clostridium sp. TaxID=1506 RepID=UPI002FC97D6A